MNVHQVAETEAQEELNYCKLMLAKCVERELLGNFSKNEPPFTEYWRNRLTKAQMAFGICKRRA